MKTFPLYESGIDRDGCIDIIKSEGLDVPPKSGCYICPFTKKSEFYQMKRLQPDLFLKAMYLEDNYKGKKQKTIRQGLSLNDVYNQQELPFEEYDPSVPCGCYDGQY
ncbi:MAG: hypothetical protein HQL01_15600 [Nitrospirae bacterium]|nr:hypothetical protein [Nitrospirota bacterium]